MDFGADILERRKGAGIDDVSDALEFPLNRMQSSLNLLPPPVKWHGACEWRKVYQLLVSPLVRFNVSLLLTKHVGITGPRSWRNAIPMKGSRGDTVANTTCHLSLASFPCRRK